MNRSFCKFIVTILLLLCGCMAGYAQVSSGNVNWRLATAYTPADTIYVFHQYPKVKKGSLTVTNPWGTPATFTWARYDTASNSFGPTFKTEGNVISSTDSLTEGGYRISLTGTTRDTAFFAWVYMDNYTVELNKDNAGKVKYTWYTCDYVHLNVKATPQSAFVYKKPGTDSVFIAKNKFKYRWSANPAPELPFSKHQDSASFRNYNPPYKDTRYSVKVTDRYGLERNDDMLYESIQTKALFELDKDSTHIVDNLNSALFRVNFINKSENAEKYTWFLGDGDSAFVHTPDEHAYTLPKTYVVRLITESAEGCIDSTSKEFEVAPPEIDAPNYFIPNGRPSKFKIYNISIRDYRITIVSRWGKKVYQSEGSDFLSWDGWDGKIQGTNNDASEGIYFYMIETTAYGENTDKAKYNSKGVYKGFVYLMRGQ